MTGHAIRHPAQRPCRLARRVLPWCVLAALLAQAAGCGGPARPDLPTDESLRLLHEAKVSRVLNPPLFPDVESSTADYEHNLGLVLFPPSLEAYRAERRRRERDAWQQLSAIQREATQRAIAARERKNREFLELQRQTSAQYGELGPYGSGSQRRALEQWLQIQKRLAYEEAARVRYLKLFESLQNRTQSAQNR